MTGQENGTEPSRRARGRPRSWNDKSAQNIIKSLDRAMEVLQYLSERQGITLSELASETNQSPATVYRVLITLEGRGLVEFDADEQLWRVGAGAFLLGSRFLRRTTLAERARPILRKLMEQTGETANLGMEKSGKVLFLGQVETHENIRAFFPPGTLSPMHASGIGKALLAEMDADRLERTLGNDDLEAFTANTIVDRVLLLTELERIRESGFSFDGEEKNLGMRCIAAPVFDASGEAVAGISVSGPTSRVTSGNIDRLSHAVVAAAAELSRAIGGKSSRP